jgi:phosphoribosyl-ATP pyrophosphohydrolase/phosphoribosyl-AMP cyclohydrolase
MNREALERTLATGRATFFSRSRGELWEKGATSGNTLAVKSVWADCDGDTLLLLVEPSGPSCHTGRATCFFRRVEASGEVTETAETASAGLERLEHTIAERAAAGDTRSYTQQLLAGGAEAIGAKLREEASELAEAAAAESAERVASEAADLLYHLLVALRLRGVALGDVLGVLAGRSGTSGLDEKARRKIPL